MKPGKDFPRRIKVLKKITLKHSHSTLNGNVCFTQMNVKNTLSF